MFWVVVGPDTRLRGHRQGYARKRLWIWVLYWLDQRDGLIDKYHRTVSEGDTSAMNNLGLSDIEERGDHQEIN